MRTRRGYTLIEMLTVIVLISTLLGLGSLVIHRMVRAERAGRAALDDSATLARLAEEFRRDAHQARSATRDAEGLALALPGEVRVEYRIREGALHVLRFVPDTTEGERLAAETVHRSSRQGTPRVDVVEQDGLTIALLAFGDPEQTTARAVRVEAVVGFDHRFERDGGTP